jgi:hypothetical protein
MEWVRERTIPTERSSFVDEVSANFCEYRVRRGQRDGSVWTYSPLSRPLPILYLPTSSSIIFARLGGPSSRPSTYQKIKSRRESNPDLWNLIARSQRRFQSLYTWHKSRTHVAFPLSLKHFIAQNPPVFCYFLPFKSTLPQQSVLCIADVPRGHAWTQNSFSLNNSCVWYSITKEGEIKVHTLVASGGLLAAVPAPPRNSSIHTEGTHIWDSKSLFPWW